MTLREELLSDWEGYNSPALQPVIDYVCGDKESAFLWIGDSAVRLVQFVKMYGLVDGGGTRSERIFITRFALRYGL